MIFPIISSTVGGRSYYPLLWFTFLKTPDGSWTDKFEDQSRYYSEESHSVWGTFLLDFTKVPGIRRLLDFREQFVYRLCKIRNVYVRVPNPLITYLVHKSLVVWFVRVRIHIMSDHYGPVVSVCIRKVFCQKFLWCVVVKTYYVFKYILLCWLRQSSSLSFRSSFLVTWVWL